MSYQRVSDKNNLFEWRQTVLFIFQLQLIYNFASRSYDIILTRATTTPQFLEKLGQTHHAFSIPLPLVSSNSFPSAIYFHLYFSALYGTTTVTLMLSLSSLRCSPPQNCLSSLIIITNTEGTLLSETMRPEALDGKCTETRLVIMPIN